MSISKTVAKAIITVSSALHRALRPDAHRLIKVYEKRIKELENPLKITTRFDESVDAESLSWGTVKATFGEPRD